MVDPRFRTKSGIFEVACWERFWIVKAEPRFRLPQTSREMNVREFARNGWRWGGSVFGSPRTFRLQQFRGLPRNDSRPCHTVGNEQTAHGHSGPAGG